MSHSGTPGNLLIKYEYNHPMEVIAENNSGSNHNKNKELQILGYEV